MHACHLVVLKQPPIFSLSKIAICNRVKNKSGKIIWTPLGWGVLRSSSWFSPLSCLSRQWADNKTNFIFLYGIGKESQRKKIRDFFLLFFRKPYICIIDIFPGDTGCWHATACVAANDGCGMESDTSERKKRKHIFMMTTAKETF